MPRKRTLTRARKGSPYRWYDFTVGSRRFRGSTGTATPETAELIAAKIRSDALLGHAVGRKPRMTLDAALGRYWLEHAAALPSAQAIDHHSRHLIAGLGAAVSLDAIDNAAVNAYVAKRRGQKRWGKDKRLVSPATVNRELVCLRAVLRLARDGWGVETAPIDWRKHLLIEPRGRTRYLTDDEAESLLAASPPHLRVAIRIAILTGLRKSNLIKLDWSQIRMRERVILVMVKDRAQGGKPLRLPISEALLVDLAALGPKDRGPVLQWQRPGKAKDGTPHKPRPIQSLRTAFKAACRRAAIADLRWHDLRHTSASWQVQEGVPLEVVREVLGHADISTTLRYAHHKDEARRDAMEALGARLGGQKVGLKKAERA